MTRPFTHKIAFLPECRPEILSPAWLDWLVEVGYTGIYLEQDPFAPTRSGNVSQFALQFRFIGLYDIAWGEHRQRLRDWINRACELAHERGLKVYLALWEPRIPAEAWGTFPVEWHGRGGYDNAPHNSISWCLGHPEARAAFQQMATEAFAAVRGLDGLKMGTHDNDAHFCNAACPRCRELAPAAQYATLFQSLLNAADAAQLHRPDFDYVLYTWWWGKDAVDSVANLMGNRRVTVLSRSTQKLPQYWKGKELGRVFDLALGVEGISREFLTETAAAHRRGWAMTDMTAFGHAFEYFWLPYTPAPHRVAERIAHLRAAGAAGWFDYDCGGIYPGINAEIIRHDSPEPQNLVERTLTTLYPAEEIAGAKAAYELAEAALAARPIAFNTDDIMNLSGRGMFELSIALPFEPTDITLLDQGHRVFFFAPANFLTPSSIPTLREMFTASADLWQRASDRIAMLRGQGTWAQAGLPWEKKVFRAHALATASACRYIEMGSYRLARARGEMTPAEECSRLLPLLRAELVAAEEFAGLWRQDRRLLDNPHWRLPRFVQACIPWVTIDQTDPFTTKLTHTRAKIASLERGTGLDAVPLWGAGNARSR